jgi:hypothetical protein
MVDVSTFQASSEDWWLHKKGGVYAILLQACPSSVVYDQGFIGTFNQTLFKRGSVRKMRIYNVKLF